MSLLSRVRRIVQPRPAHASRTREEWERQYASGAWSLLSRTDEMARYWIAVGYCAQKFRSPSVLDVGCGSGLMEEKLRGLACSFYLGIDFSLNALVEMRSKPGPPPPLVCADMTRLCLRRRFDAILFMEALEPGQPVVEILDRYRPLLNPGGRMIVSLFDGLVP